MRLQFFNDEWEEFIAECGFTDDELKIVPFLRRGWYSVDIAAELCLSVSTFKRRKKRIEQKIIRYISRAG
jgi:DNA-binding NarL/FixJ family response regulator